jgi:hypothetical protein
LAARSSLPERLITEPIRISRNAMAKPVIPMRIRRALEPAFCIIAKRKL